CGLDEFRDEGPMTEHGMRFRIGLFVLLTLVLLATLVTLFGSLPSFFKQYQQYTVTFADAPGVTPGTPVRRSGVRVGEVKSVDLDHDSGEVNAQALTERPHKLPRHEHPTLVQGLLGSDASIDLVPDPAGKDQPVDRSPVEPGTVIAGKRHPGVGALLSKAAEVM